MKEIRLHENVVYTSLDTIFLQTGQHSPQKDLPASIKCLGDDNFEVSVSQEGVRTLHHHALSVS